MKRMSKPATPVAYSYIRFSHPTQALGDSERRQTDMAVAYCARRGWHLDTRLTLRDLGVSAFRGKNAAVGNFRTFLDAVRTGKVAAGSVLIVESIDRISRQGIDEGYDLIKHILKADVRIVTLSPEREFDREATKSLSKGALEIQVILERAAEESERKSQRCGAAWVQKRKQARELGQILTRKLPAWIEERGGKLKAISSRANVVRHIFELAARGYGMTSIVKRLIAKKVPAFGPSGEWSRSYVGLILRDRRVIGELQPRRQDRTPDGPLMPNYYPAVITEEQFFAARSGTAQRRQKQGRLGRHVNIFSGLVKNAIDGDSYIAVTRSDSRRGRRSSQRVLMNSQAAQGRARITSFPLTTFERAILAMLAEVDPRSVLGEDEGPDESMVLTGELDHVDSKIAELEAELLKGDVATIAKVLRQLELRKQELTDKLRDLQARNSKSLPVAWKEARTLLTLLDSSPDETDSRLQMRSVLRRVIDSMWLIVVPRGHARVAYVQVWFVEGKRHRDYLIVHLPSKANASARTEGRWYVRSMRGKKDSFDLRTRQGAAEMEKILEWIDLNEFDEQPGRKRRSRRHA